MFLNRFKKTKEKTASYAEDLPLYESSLFHIAQDRYSIVKDVNFLCGPNGDIRFQRANSLIGDDATHGGFSIVVNGSDADKKRKLKEGKVLPHISIGAERIQKILDDYLERTQLHILCTEHAKALLRDGDLFLNILVDTKTGLIIKIKRVPALTMKRNTDEYGEFINPERAFSQVDSSQVYKMAKLDIPQGSRIDFPLYQINHIRWLSDETKHYGISQYAVARKCYKMIEKMEEALANRRIYRSVSKRSHKLDTTDISDIEEYKRANAMIDKNGNPTKNAHMLSDYIGNVEITALHDEANLDEIKDIETLENTLWINLLTPKAIITGGQNINRDVLKVQYPHYLQSLNTITDTLEYGDNSSYSGYRDIIDLQLLLAGINPETISYDIVWSKKSEESTQERVEAIQNALGKNGGKQLISHEKAIQLIAGDFKIEDPAAMYQKILEENQEGISKENKEDILKDNQTSFEFVLCDEAIEDKPKMDKLHEEFYKKWNSFLNLFFDNIDSNKEITNLEDFLNLVNEVWQDMLINDVPPFYLEYVYKAGAMATDTAQKHVDNIVIVDGIENKVRIKRQDIYNDLFKNSGIRIKNINSTTVKDIRDVLSNSFDNNIGWKYIMDKIRPIIRNPVRAEMISLTELSWAYNRSTKFVYKEAGIKTFIWDSSVDMKTCDYCNSMNKTEHPANNLPNNPAHPRCRCTWLPKM